VAADTTAAAVVLVAPVVLAAAVALLARLVAMAEVTSGLGVRRVARVVGVTRGVARVAPVTRGARRIRGALAVPIPSPLAAAGTTAPAAPALRGTQVATSAA
jgi:hypothetical protein